MLHGLIRRPWRALSLVALAGGWLGCGHRFETARTEPRLREPSQSAAAATERLAAPTASTERVTAMDRGATRGTGTGVGVSAAATRAPALPLLVRPPKLLERPPAPPKRAPRLPR